MGYTFKQQKCDDISGDQVHDKPNKYPHSRDSPKTRAKQLGLNYLLKIYNSINVTTKRLFC